LHYPAFFPIRGDGADSRDCSQGDPCSRAVETGAAHAELILRPDGRVWMVEMAARPGGGHIFHTVVSQVSGVNMVQELAKMLMGMEPHLKPLSARGAAYRFFHPPQGRIREIMGVQEATSMEGVLALGIQVKPGDVIVSWPGNTIGRICRDCG